MKNKKNVKKAKAPEKNKKPKTVAKFGVLGKELASQFSGQQDRAWRPTKPGGRNGQGRP